MHESWKASVPASTEASAQRQELKLFHTGGTDMTYPLPALDTLLVYTLYCTPFSPLLYSTYSTLLWHFIIIFGKEQDTMSKARLRAGVIKMVVLHHRILLLSVFQRIFPALLFYSHTHEVVEKLFSSCPFLLTLHPKIYKVKFDLRTGIILCIRNVYSHEAAAYFQHMRKLR